MTTGENFRVDDKQNVNMNGKRTAFTLFRKRGDAFVCEGRYTAKGYNATDAACISAALETQAHTDAML